jgi:hypothetical protein
LRAWGKNNWRVHRVHYIDDGTSYLVVHIAAWVHIAETLIRHITVVDAVVRWSCGHVLLRGATIMSKSHLHEHISMFRHADCRNIAFPSPGVGFDGLAA